MMNMINTTGMNGMGLGIIWLHVHWFFGGFAIVGFILLIIWAAKHLSDKPLKSLTIWLLTVGIIGTLITAVPAMSGFQRMMSVWRGADGMQHMMNKDEQHMNMPMMEQMMKMMMEHASTRSEHGDAIDTEDHDGMNGMMNMNQ